MEVCPGVNEGPGRGRGRGDGEYEVRREQSIGASPSVVFGLLADFHRWREWSPWDELDPNLTQTYGGAESGVGATYAWSGNRRAGQGRMEIVDAAEPSKVVVDLRSEKPFKSRSTTTLTVDRTPEGSRVTWRMVGPVTFATHVMGLFKSMDATVGPDFERGLTRLKRAAEGGAAR